MKESICQFAQESADRDERWRGHAAVCPDCGDLLAVAEWMTGLAAGTAPPRNLPAAGFLLFKSRVRERLSAADRATRPIHVMGILAGILFAVTFGLALGRPGSVQSAMSGAAGLLTSYAGVIVFVAIVGAAVCAAVAYFGKLTRT